MQHISETRQDDLRFEVGNQAEKSDQPGDIDRGLLPEHAGQIVRREQIANERKTIIGIQDFQGGLPGDQHHRHAHITRCVADLFATLAETFQKRDVLLPATAPQADDMNPPRRDPVRSRPKGFVVGLHAVDVVPRR